MNLKINLHRNEGKYANKSSTAVYVGNGNE